MQFSLIIILHHQYKLHRKAFKKQSLLKTIHLRIISELNQLNYENPSWMVLNFMASHRTFQFICTSGFETFL